MRRLPWLLLVVLALVWGFISGLAFASSTWLNPATALFGMLGVLVIAGSLVMAEKGRGDA